MIGFNHAAVGGLLATVLPLPLAIPVAVASHFVLDALPHYGIPHRLRDKSRFWKVVGIGDFAASWLILGCLSLFAWDRPDIFLCGLAAASPDFIWVLRILRHRSFDLSHNTSRFTRWHVAIQRYERPWGIYIELPLAVLLFWWLQRIATV